MSQHFTWLPLKGLVTNPNWRQAEGSAQVSLNISWAAPGVAQLRRGIVSRDTGPSYTIRGLSIAPLHEDKLFTHWSDGTVRDMGDTYFSATTYAHPAGSSYGVRWARSGGRLFFTTSKGLYKIASPASSASADLLPAGGFDPPIPGLQALTNGAGFNWLAASATVAYRTVIIRKDPLNNIIVSEPSGRAVVTNTAGGSRYPTIRCYLPYRPTHQDEVTLQLYRSAQDTAGGEPSDDMGLVYERKLTTAELAGTSVDVIDYSADAMRGEALYTNARQDGISQRRQKPPKMYDVAEFGGCLFGARTTPPHRLQSTVVGIDLSGFGSGFWFVCDGYLYEPNATEDVANYLFAYQTTGTASQNARDTAESLCRCINYRYRSTAGGIRASVVSDGQSGLTEILLERTTVDGSVIYAGFADAAGTSTAMTFSPALTRCAMIDEVGTPMTRAASTVTVNTMWAHNLSPGDSVYICGIAPEAAFPVGIKTVATTPSGTSFTYTEAGTATGNTTWYAALEINSDTVKSTQLEQKNRLCFTRQDEPEAWPEENEFFVGAANEPIKRIFASRDSLWVFKGDGTWRISGYSPDTFSLDPFDSSLLLHADNSLALGEGQVYGWFSTGIYALDESGAQHISGPIQDQVDLDRPVTSSSTQAHAIWDPFDNSYQLWRKQGTASGASAGWFAHVYWPSTGCWSSYQYLNSSAEAANDVSASAVTKPPTSLSLPDSPTPFYLITGSSSSGTSDVISTRDTNSYGHLWYDYTDGIVTGSLGFMFHGGAPGEQKHFQRMRVLTNVTRTGSTESYAFGGIQCPSTIDGTVTSTYNLVDGSTDTSASTATKLAVGRTQQGYIVHAPIDARRGAACEAAITIYSGGAPGIGGADGGSNVRIEGIEIAWRATRNDKGGRGTMT